MSDPQQMTALDFAAISAVIGALATVIVTLWKWGQSQVKSQRLQFQEQIASLVKENEMRADEQRDLVIRVRSLESDRIADLKGHADKMAGLVIRGFEEAQQNRAVLRDIASLLRKSPCITEQIPEPRSDRLRKERGCALEPHTPSHSMEVPL